MDKVKEIFISAIVGLFVLSLLYSCHKYPEDPFISFRKPEKRIRGQWTITSYQINGTEHLHDFDSILSPRTLKDLTLEFADDGYGVPIYRLYYYDAYKEVLTDGNASFSSINIISLRTIDTLLVEKLWNMPKVKPNAQWTSADWGVKKLYRNDCHLRRNNLDIYLKRK